MASSPQHEPTMEEILASIRKIISEDAAEPAPEAPKTVAAEADVLDLTQEVHDEPPAPPPAPVVVAAPPPPPPAPEPEPVVQAAPEPAPKPENDVVFQTIEESSMSEAAAVSQPHEGIFSDKTRKALEDSFSSIQPPKPEPIAAPESAPRVAASSDPSTVQEAFERAVSESFEPVLKQWLGANADTVVEHMKPLVREWLDEHFPALLEGAVRAEVERVARARH
jgi:uncharacterized protein